MMCLVGVAGGVVVEAQAMTNDAAICEEDGQALSPNPQSSSTDGW